MLEKDMGPPPADRFLVVLPLAKREHQKGWKADDGTHVVTRNYQKS